MKQPFLFSPFCTCFFSKQLQMDRLCVISTKATLCMPNCFLVCKPLLIISLLQVFFVICLTPEDDASQRLSISDPDPLISCDLMDGRDAFLTMAREKHYEFSSLRRAKFSSMAMMFELHNQGQERFVYTCNECKQHVETRYHCTVCEVSREFLFAIAPSEQSTYVHFLVPP